MVIDVWKNHAESFCVVFRKMKRLLGVRGINPAHAGSLFVLIFGLVLTSFNLHKLSVLQQDFIKLNNPGSSEKCQINSGLRLPFNGIRKDETTFTIETFSTKSPLIATPIVSTQPVGSFLFEGAELLLNPKCAM